MEKLTEEKKQATIDALCDNGLIARRAAKSLHIDRNTLIYRVDRIRDKTGLNALSFVDMCILKPNIPSDKIKTAKAELSKEEGRLILDYIDENRNRLSLARKYKAKSISISARHETFDKITEKTGLNYRDFYELRQLEEMALQIDYTK